jgi:MinD-like ATPase involved in chromosome partitioning or flagellar assembly
VFQPLTKADVTEKQVDAFLKKKLGVSLSGVKDVYVLADAPATCARPVMEFFAIGDTLLIPFGGSVCRYVKQ